MNTQEASLHRLELKIAYLLRYGVIAAGILMAVGWALSLYTHGERLGQFKAYAPQGLAHTLRAAKEGGDAGTLVALAGLALLVLLPVARVLLTGVLFLRQGDQKLAALAFLVLAVLVLSFALGIEL